MDIFSRQIFLTGILFGHMLDLMKIYQFVSNYTWVALNGNNYNFIIVGPDLIKASIF